MLKKLTNHVIIIDMRLVYTMKKIGSLALVLVVFVVGISGLRRVRLVR